MLSLAKIPSLLLFTFEKYLETSLAHRTFVNAFAHVVWPSSQLGGKPSPLHEIGLASSGADEERLDYRERCGRYVSIDTLRNIKRTNRECFANSQSRV